MPTYEIQGPTGRNFEMQAPSMEAAQRALASIPDNQLLGMLQQPAASPIASLSDAELMRQLDKKYIQVPGKGVVEFPGHMSDDEIAAAIKANTPSTAGDIAQSAGTGVIKGAIGTLGLPALAAEYLGRGSDIAGNYIGGKLGFPPAPQPGDVNQALGAGAITRGVESLTGKLYEPQTVPGQYAQTAGEFLPAVIGGPQSVLAKLATRVAAPAVASETAGQLAKGSALETPARIGGALAGSFAPSALARVVTPFPASAARTAAADTLAQEGITLTAGQKTGSKALQYAESTLGDLPLAGGKTSAAREAQGEAFTRVALRNIGEDAERATPQVIDRAFNRIGGQFDALAGRNSFEVDQALGHDLHATVSHYYDLVGPTARAPIIENTARDIINLARRNGNVIPGEAYQDLRSRLGRATRSATGETQEALHDLRTALDDAMERSLAQTGNTADLAAWQQARQQYRNILVIEKAASGAGESTASGILSPAQIRQAAVAQSRRDYVRGRGDFADLTRAAIETMTPLPQSGTAPRSFMQHLPGMLGAGLGTAAGGAPGGMAGAMIGAAGPGLLGRALMSPLVQGYLGNQLIQNARRNPRLATALTATLPAQRQ